jgi:hypothetical protein
MVHILYKIITWQLKRGAAQVEFWSWQLLEDKRKKPFGLFFGLLAQKKTSGPLGLSYFDGTK